MGSGSGRTIKKLPKNMTGKMIKEASQGIGGGRGRVVDTVNPNIMTVKPNNVKVTHVYGNSFADSGKENVEKRIKVKTIA